MKKNEGSCSVLRSLNLDNLEEVVSEAYHQEGAGRPPRKPIGIFKALIVKRVKQIPSDRELYRRLSRAGLSLYWCKVVITLIF